MFKHHKPHNEGKRSSDAGGIITPPASPIRSATQPLLYVRHLVKNDLPAVLKIESESFREPWSDSDFSEALSGRHCIGQVVEIDEPAAHSVAHSASHSTKHLPADVICGFVIYELFKTNIQILNFAVASKYRRRGIGSYLVGRLKEKLSGNYRRRLRMLVGERNLAAQLFLRANGFRAVNIVKEASPNGDDGIWMAWRIGQGGGEHQCKGA